MGRDLAALAAIVVVAFGVRVLPAWETVFGGESVNFLETDAWYHVRLVEYQVRNFRGASPSIRMPPSAASTCHRAALRHDHRGHRRRVARTRCGDAGDRAGRGVRAAGARRAGGDRDVGAGPAPVRPRRRPARRGPARRPARPFHGSHDAWVRRSPCPRGVPRTGDGVGRRARGGDARERGSGRRRAGPRALSARVEQRRVPRRHPRPVAGAGDSRDARGRQPSAPGAADGWRRPRRPGAGPRCPGSALAPLRQPGRGTRGPERAGADRVERR